MKNILIAITLVVVTVGGTLFYFQSNQNTVANQVTDVTEQASSSDAEETTDDRDLQTYVNEAYGYSFQYPEGWWIYDDPANQKALERKAIAIYPDEYSNPRVAGKSYRGMHLFTANQFEDFGDLLNSYEGQVYEGRSVQLASVDGYPAAIIDEENGGFGGVKKFYVFGQEDTFSGFIDYAGTEAPQDYRESANKIFDAVLETFTVLE